MISDKNKIAKVMNAEKSPNQALPKTIVACAPAPIQPKVCATVLNAKMAANDCSILSTFRRLSMLDFFGFVSCKSAIYDGVMLRSAASASEQMNEMPMAMSTNKISSSTLLAVGFATSPAAQTACGSKEVSNRINAENDLLLKRVI